jgi:protein-S-isoprenylcysteine O-methyltransferase Ste14
MNNKIPERQIHRNLILPRWSIPFVWAGIVLVIQVLLPWAIARIGPHFGWIQQTPSLWNFTGLIAVVIGLALYSWCLVNHFRSYLASVSLSFNPPHLVVTGPYVFSRNPMYLSGLCTWLGWVVYYGSPAVFIAFVLLWSMFTFYIIPSEERQLEKLFSSQYLEYKRTVHRWIGRF